MKGRHGKKGRKNEGREGDREKGRESLGWRIKTIINVICVAVLSKMGRVRGSSILLLWLQLLTVQEALKSLEHLKAHTSLLKVCFTPCSHVPSGLPDKFIFPLS